MIEDRFLKRLRKKARKGLRGWPIATVAFYGPNLSQATKVTVGIVPSENADVKELRDWKVDRGDIRADPGIAQEILEFIDQHRVLSVAMTNSIIGCPHQEGIDYEGEWCPACEFWHGRDRFTGQTVNSILAARTAAASIVREPNVMVVNPSDYRLREPHKTIVSNRAQTSCCLKRCLPSERLLRPANGPALRGRNPYL